MCKQTNCRAQGLAGKRAACRVAACAPWQCPSASPAGTASPASPAQRTWQALPTVVVPPCIRERSGFRAAGLEARAPAWRQASQWRRWLPLQPQQQVCEKGPRRQMPLRSERLLGTRHHRLAHQGATLARLGLLVSHTGCCLQRP